jgi:organic radical activating enzyme
MNEIISVLPTEEYFSLNWMLGIRCNYDCMYCSKDWHDAQSKHHELETLKAAWQEIYNKTCHHGRPYKISFTGGELTTNKNFLPFVSWLNENYKDQLFEILASTNGSASYNYYLKMFDHVKNITFSVHSEFIDEKNFFDKIVKLNTTKSAKSFLHVAIMDEYWNQERIKIYVDLLERNNVSYSINKIDYRFKTRNFPILKGTLNLGI